MLKDFYNSIDSHQLKSEQLQTRSFPLQSDDFERLAQGSKLFPQLLWRSRAKEYQLLALGIASTTEVGSHQLAALSFESKEHWEHFESQYHYTPIIVFEKNRVTFNFNGHVNLLAAIESFEKNEFHSSDELPLSKESIPTRQQFLESFDRALIEMKEQRVDKIVLARKELYEYKDHLDPFALFNRCKEDDASYQLLFRPDSEHAFISFSPERLFFRKHEQIECDAMAGTISSDEKIENLTHSNKQEREHAFVARDIVAKLSTICKEVNLTETPKVTSLTHLKHLHSTVKGNGCREESDLQIAKLLHPTPAVGGLPWPKAWPIIKKCEPFIRGFYAAPWGIITNEFSEFMVGIRSALVEKNRLHIFAGAGIVEDSKGECEWQEMENKMEQFTSKITTSLGQN